MTVATLQTTPALHVNAGVSENSLHARRAEALAALTDVERHVLEALSRIRFGTLEVTVHDSRVVQVEKSEKIRFDPKGKLVSDSLS